MSRGPDDSLQSTRGNETEPVSAAPSRGRDSRPPHRLALAVVALAILAIGAVFAVSTYVVLYPSHSSDPGNGCGPCGGPELEIGAPTPGVNGTNWTYTILLAPSSDLTPADTQLEILTSSGALLPPIAGSTVEVLGLESCLSATYSFVAGAWANGPVTAGNHCTPPGTAGTVLTSVNQLLLNTGSTNLRAAGDAFEVVVVSPSFSGTVQTNLP